MKGLLTFLVVTLPRWLFQRDRRPTMDVNTKERREMFIRYGRQ